MSEVKFMPVRDFLVVEKRKMEELKTAGGIIVPGSDSNEKVTYGKVLSVGSGTITDSGTRVEPEVKVGDTVYFLKSLAVDLTVEGNNVLVLREEHVMLRVVS